MIHWTDELVKMDACPEAVEWARQYPTVEAAWEACERPDWMIWLACHKTKPLRKRPFVAIAYEMARSIEHLNMNPVVRKTNDLVEKYLAGKRVSQKALNKAAGAAAGAAEAAWAAAWASDAAWAAAWATEAAEAAEAAWAAGAAAGADIVRKHLACPKL